MHLILILNHIGSIFSEVIRHERKFRFWSNSQALSVCNDFCCVTLNSLLLFLCLIFCISCVSYKTTPPLQHCVTSSLRRMDFSAHCELPQHNDIIQARSLLKGLDENFIKQVLRELTYKDLIFDIRLMTCFWWGPIRLHLRLCYLPLLHKWLGHRTGRDTKQVHRWCKTRRSCWLPQRQGGPEERPWQIRGLGITNCIKINKGKCCILRVGWGNSGCTDG